MRGFVVGRTAIDAYLISYIKKGINGDADLIDATNAGISFIFIFILVCAVHMTDSRGNKAGEQGNKGKSLYNVKWNENPSLTGPNWYNQFKKRSLPTSVSNADYMICI